MSSLTYVTKEGLEKLKAELHDLKTNGRRDMSLQIAEARDKGDLSENAEYDAAKDAQGLMEMKIALLEDKVAKARIIDESNFDPNKVSILSTVKIKNVKNAMVVTYTIVPEEEADLKSGKISVKSPIAAGLIGKEKGEIAKVIAPAGAMEFEVLEISRD